MAQAASQAENWELRRVDCILSREQKAQQMWGIEKLKPGSEDKTWRPGGLREPDQQGQQETRQASNSELRIS